MQGFAAALASKTREGKSLVQKSVAEDLVTDRYQRPANETEHDEVHIPYDPSCKKTFENDPEDLCVLPKPIYILSDCTGNQSTSLKDLDEVSLAESAARTVRAALGQFESSIQTHCPTTLLMHRFVSDEKRICEVVEAAAKENALVVFTLVDPKLVKIIQTACGMYEVKYVDLWSNLLDIMEEHLNASRRYLTTLLRNKICCLSALPMNHPNKARRKLDPEYFRRIEAVEYTRRMDDGANPENWNQADILLLGVSRSGKTPLSIFLGQRGFKVANLPLVKDFAIPPELYEIDQSKIFALTVDPQYLFKIRRSRMGSMGVANGKSMYADLKGVVEELAYAHTIYNTNPIWPVLDVTNIGVEESAAKIQKILNDRQGASEQVMYA